MSLITQTNMLHVLHLSLHTLQFRFPVQLELLHTRLLLRQVLSELCHRAVVRGSHFVQLVLALVVFRKSGAFLLPQVLQLLVFAAGNFSHTIIVSSNIKRIAQKGGKKM